MIWNKKEIQPRDNELIEIQGYDWSAFKMVGKFVPYNKPGNNPNKNGVSRHRRFCTVDGNNSHDDWLSTELWRYCDQPT